MKRLIRWPLIVTALGLTGWASYGPTVRSWKERNRINYREAAVSRGKIVAVVNSTGTVKPVRSVLVGSVVSGPIETIYVDFNDEVRKDQLLAKIDQRIYQASVARDKATLATAKAQVQRVQAELQKAKNDEARSQALR